jgi:hypothetical protein
MGRPLQPQQLDEIMTMSGFCGDIVQDFRVSLKKKPRVVRDKTFC